MPENRTADRTGTADEQAEKRTEETHSFMRSVRRATRRKYTPEEKIRTVLEGFRRETTVNDLCRREGINPANYYSWTKEFMEAGEGEACPQYGTVRHAAGDRRAQAWERGSEGDSGRSTS